MNELDAIAKGAVRQICRDLEMSMLVRQDTIRAAIDKALEYALTKEPSEAMMREGADFLSITPGQATNKTAGYVYNAMAVVLLEELKGNSSEASKQEG